MTNEEAIKLMRSIRRTPANWICEYEAIDIAIEALEKQIPKKPDIEIWDLSSDDDNDVYCPTCGMLLGSTHEMENNNFYTPHCYYCGQKLKWGD